MPINTTVERIIFEGEDRISAATKSARGGTDALRQSLDSVKSTLGALGVTIGAGAFVNLHYDALKAVAALDDVAEMTGASVEGLSAIQRVAKVGGQDFEGFSAQIGKMLKGLREGSEEGGKTAQALGFLGISVRNANGDFRDTSEIIVELAEKLSKYKDNGEKVILVQDALGKGAERYLPLLKDLAENTDRYATVTGKQAAEAEKAEKNINRLKISMEDMRKELVNELVPGLNKMLEVMIAIRDLRVNPIRQGQLLASIGMGEDPAGKLKEVEDRLAALHRQREALRDLGVMQKIMNPEDDVILGHQIKLAEQERATYQAIIAKRGRSNAAGLAEDAAGNVGPAPALPSVNYTSGESAKKQKDKVAELEFRVAMERMKREDDAVRAGDEQFKKTNELEARIYQERLKREDEIVQRADEEQKRKDDAARQEIARLQDVGRTELQMEEVRYRKRRAIIEQSVLDDQQKYEAMEALREEHEKNQTQITDDETARRYGIQKVYHQLDLESTRSFFGVMSGMMNSKNREMFEIGKTAAIAGAIIDTYKAATGAYASLASIPIVGPALGAAAAAAAIVAGMANVNAIRAQKFGGGGGATPTFSASPTTGLPTGTPGGDVGAGTSRQTTVIELRGGEFFSREQIRELVERINENSRDGGNVVFAETRR